MNDLNTILHQVEKKRFALKESRWLTIEELHTQHQVPGLVVRGADPIDKMSGNFTQFKKIKHQIRKKSARSKPRVERLADKSLLLSDRLIKPYK
jgi:hypothetical protein